VEVIPEMEIDIQAASTTPTDVAANEPATANLETGESADLLIN
jgi:hypothetical protein